MGGGGSIVKQANPNNPNGMEVGGGTTNSSNTRNLIQQVGDGINLMIQIDSQ